MKRRTIFATAVTIDSVVGSAAGIGAWAPTSAYTRLSAFSQATFERKMDFKWNAFRGCYTG